MAPFLISRFPFLVLPVPFYSVPEENSVVGVAFWGEPERAPWLREQLDRKVRPTGQLDRKVRATDKNVELPESLSEPRGCRLREQLVRKDHMGATRWSFLEILRYCTRGAMQSVQELETGTAEQLEKRLARRRDQARAKRQSETAENREKRLAKRRAKKQSERAEDREKRLAIRREQARTNAQTHAGSSRLNHSSQTGASELETDGLVAARAEQNALCDMVGREGETFSNKVLCYASSLRGSRQYWFKQRNRLISMVDTLGLPTIFFTHSAADLQWPELARLLCPEDPDSSSNRTQAINDNPALADWFFCYRIQLFVEVFYKRILGATDYWMRFEWQHRGSPHVHEVAWLPNAPDVEQLLKSTDNIETVKEEIVHYANTIVSTINPAVAPDGRDVESAPPPVTQPQHICNRSYLDVDDHQQDLSQLIATCQRHTRCSEAYCLRTYRGKQACRFGYPKPLQPNTTIVLEDEPVLSMME